MVPVADRAHQPHPWHQRRGVPGPRTVWRGPPPWLRPVSRNSCATMASVAGTLTRGSSRPSVGRRRVGNARPRFPGPVSHDITSPNTATSPRSPGNGLVSSSSIAGSLNMTNPPPSPAPSMRDRSHLVLPRTLRMLYNQHTLFPTSVGMIPLLTTGGNRAPHSGGGSEGASRYLLAPSSCNELQVSNGPGAPPGPSRHADPVTPMPPPERRHHAAVLSQLDPRKCPPID